MSTPNPDSTPTNRPEARLTQAICALFPELRTGLSDDTAEIYRKAAILARHCPQSDGGARRLLEEAWTILSQLDWPKAERIAAAIDVYLSRTADKEGGGT